MWNGSHRWAYTNAFAPMSEGQKIVLLSREVGHAAVPSFMEAELNPDVLVPCFNHWNTWRKEEMRDEDRCSRQILSLRQILLFMGTYPYTHPHTHPYTPTHPLSFFPYHSSSKSLKLLCRLGEPILQPAHRYVVRFLLGDPGICVGLNPTGKRGMWRQVSHILWSALIHDLVDETVCLWESPASPPQGLFCASPVQCSDSTYRHDWCQWDEWKKVVCEIWWD